MSCPMIYALGSSEIRKYQGNLKLGQRQSLVPRNKALVRAAKNYAEADIKIFWSCPVLLDFFILSFYFFFATVCLNKFFLLTHPSLLQTSILSWVFFLSFFCFFFFGLPSLSIIFNANIKQISSSEVPNLRVFCKLYSACLIQVKK